MPSWSVTSEMTFTVAKSILLYTVPLIFMSFTYYQIVRVLWKSANIPGHTEARAAAAAVAASAASASSSSGTGSHAGCTCSSAGSAAIRCCFHQGGHCSGRQQSSTNNGRGISGASSASRHTTSSVGGTVLMTNTNVSTEGQLRSRRKAAKMLVAVVLMFAVCYFPVHLLGIMRYMVKLPQTDEWVALSMISHWLCYANSAVNPVIYNFMSGKFRKEFRRTFCFWWRHRPRDRAQVGRRVNGSLMDKSTRIKKGGWRMTGWLKGRQRGGHSTRNASTTTGHSRGSSYYKSLFRSTLRHNANGPRSAMATEYEDFEGDLCQA
ncbi:5-hydroxytryptamine receptor 1-like [Ischnura elegans]|uniref:5-hydroxytryptamine receptor 1-like n=1 Tax=Ischnura elegans TaxID=197161 RepID=UPI001ED8B332|nr:5-hydroxytryptamine receptor 1-like [Ischnura elegans]